MSIRQKIVLSFLGVIVLLMMSLGSVFLFHATSLKEYKNISNTLMLENTLTGDVAVLMEVYSELLVAPTSESRSVAYLDQRDKILQTFEELDAIVHQDSWVTYRGLKNSILSVIADLDKGRELLMLGDVVGASGYYEEAIDKRPHVESNATSLVLKELQHLDSVKATIEYKYKEQLFVVIMWIIATILTTLLYALIFARRITTPIKILSATSQKVAGGDYSLRIPKYLLDSNDEVGRLANVFNMMLITINAKITEVETGNKIVMETKHHLEERNEELEKFNKMVIGRELKMVELKNRVKTLEDELGKTKA